MEPARLVDQRDRNRIATDLTRRFAVDAGAGSGKTTSLVDRIVSLVSDGHLPMGSVAAITFTEAAAAELRLRVRRRLAERAREDPRLLVAARDVDDAAICTIHAFALRILSEHWLEAGLPPNIEVLDAANEHLDHKERWREFTTGLLYDPGAMATLVRAFAAGLRLSQLSAIARALADHHDRLTPQVLEVLAEERRRLANPHVDVTTLVEDLRRALAYQSRCRDASDRLCDHLLTTVTSALARLAPLVGSDDEATVISVLDDVGRLSPANIGQKGNWMVGIEEVRDACKDAEAARSGILDAVRQSVVSDLAWRMAQCAVDGARARRAEGRFTFHDLLVESCRLLGTNDEVRGAARDRYRCLLIDEFQDTDPLQAELAHLLGDSAGPGTELARLFVVGDPEQSIYRFRRADVVQFDTAVARMDERLSLTSNFRSVPEILGFVDAVFGRLPTAGGPHTIAHRSLAPVRRGDSQASGGPPVAVFGGPHDEGRARDVRLQSTAEVASAIRTIVTEGWSVDTETDRRPATFGDIAVLLPTRTALPMLERALEDADIPYRLEGATLVWASQDVRDLLAIARAVVDPADPVAVVAALRTPALACGDDDLVRFHAAGGSWDPRADPVIDRLGADDPVVNAMATLAALHERRMWMEPSALVLHVMTELHLLELALVHRRPRDHWQRLRWVLDQVRAFDEARGGTLGDFLEWVDLSQEAERWSSSLGPPELDDDAVRVMTIHGAKGLEFPVVVLTGLDSPPANVPPPLIFDGDGHPRFRFTAHFRSPTYDGLAGRDKVLDEAERQRLLYVALTRARDHLLVDLNHKEKSHQAMAAILYPICEQITEGVERISPPVAQERTAPTVSEPEESRDDWWSEHRRWIERRARSLSSRARQPAWSATALSRATAEDDGVPVEPGPGRSVGVGGPPPGDPEVQRRIGRAVHDALAKIELPTTGVLPHEATEIAVMAARSQHLDDSGAALVVGLVRSAVASTLVRSIAAGRHWKELPLAAPLPGEQSGGDGQVIEGFADLVGETPDGLVVVDFKTAGGAAASAQYLLQVAIYAYALREATGRQVERVVVSYLGVDGTEEEWLEGVDLDRAIARVLAAAGPDGNVSRLR